MKNDLRSKRVKRASWLTGSAVALSTLGLAGAAKAAPADVST